ncbi:MAG TPA: TraB/GumN family protein [Croceibacterium sp.]|nr:TraB/GumN family protein [Croceibacterium sp.]
MWLAACGDSGAREPTPALWEVSGPRGETGWLFGTVHALPDGTRWRTPRLASVLERTGVLVVEVANLGEPGAAAGAFAAVASSPGLPPLLSRVAPADRPALAAALARAGLAEADFAETESWAAALQIANATREGDSGNGVDRALLGEGLPVIALEGFAGQFAIFDRLPEADQAGLLQEAAREDGPAEERALVAAWLAGDLAALERETREGMLADPELREALLTGRNRAWAARIAELLRADRRPLVAVGAGHMLGPDGLPALLAARGYAVRRIQ